MPTKVGQKSGAYHHGDLKAQLVEATRALVEEHGPDRFSVAQACRLAGVSTAAPYRHFETRQDMLDAVSEDGLRRMHTRLIAAAKGHAPGSDEAVTALGEAYVAFALAEPGVYRLTFSMTAEDDPERVAKMKDMGHACFGAVLDQVAHRYALPPDNPRVLETGLQLWTMVHGLSFLLIDGKLGVMELPVDISGMLARASAALLNVST
jgi:AcrR family transcriptional regulator